MIKLDNKDRAVLELISKQGVITQSQIHELIYRKGTAPQPETRAAVSPKRSKIFQEMVQTSAPGAAAPDAIGEQINSLIDRGLLSKSGEHLSVSAQGEQSLSLLISSIHMRRAIGLVGIALPIVLLFGNLFFGNHVIQGSISAYYHTSMRNIFVGAMCAIAVFLISYRGFERDYLWTSLAGAFAILVALFPTKRVVVEPDKLPPLEEIAGNLHLVFAGITFAALAGVCFVLFTKTDVPQEDMKLDTNKGKRIRNRIYRICGGAIVFCILAIIVVTRFPESSPIMQIKPIFILEFLALVAFGVSWVIKSNWNIALLRFLQDKEADINP